MRRLASLLLASAIALAGLPAAHAADAAPANASSSATHDSTDPRIPAHETAVRTQHSVAIGGRTIRYTATAGTVIIRDDKQQPQASVFYVAYTVDDGKPS